MKENKKPIPKLSELIEDNNTIINSKPNTNTNSLRLLKLKFYFDNPSRNQVNKLVTFEVKSPEDAIRVITKFDLEGAKIKAAFLNPNDKNLSKKMGIRFEFKSHPLYKYFKK